MAETLVSSPDSENEDVDIETLRRLLMQIKESRASIFDYSDTSVLDPQKPIEEFIGKLTEIDMVEPQNLEPEDFDAYKEILKKEISLAEEENVRLSSEINSTSKTIEEETNQLDKDVEKLAFSLELVDSQGLQHFQAESGESLKSTTGVLQEQNIEILKLSQQIEKIKSELNSMQDLDRAVKRIQAIGQIEDNVSSIKVLDFEDNSIRLSLTTYIPSDGLLRHNLGLMEPGVVEHEMLIVVAEKTLEIHRAEIFPNDVSLDAIIHTVKSASHLPLKMDETILQYFVTQVQFRILLCTIRRSLVKDANQSRHSFEYSDKDEMIILHSVGGIDAFIKIPHSWPLSTSALTLTSIRNLDTHSNISLSFLCKVKELANALSIQTRGHVVAFADAIEEILVKEMRSK